jgi:hypothetical protein
MVVAALATAAAVSLGGYLARGTTAVPAAIWATVAALGLAAEGAATAAGWLSEPASQASFRLVVASLAVCPVMSILGAKRPQHGVWQFIVATLAGVLALPAITATLVRPGSLPDLHILERFFLPLLVIVGWLNFVATRRSLAVTSVSIGQVALMWAFLPLVGSSEPLAPEYEAGAASLVAIGAWLAVVQAVLWPVGAKGYRGLAATIDPPFLALRETLGAAWTLRIAERFNAVAEERGWPSRLRFGGLVVDAPGQADPSEADANRCLRSLLRRFVSTAWLERHAGSGRDVAQSAGVR